MFVYPIYPPAFGANCYIAVSETHALVVDPSLSPDVILEKVKELEVNVEAILLTHGHFDHTVAIDKLRDALSCPVMIHEQDAIMLTDGTKNAYLTFFGRSLTYRAADLLLTDGQSLSLGKESITVLHTPGHSPGSVCYYAGELLFTGDTLFADNIGRCDLWGGDETAMKASLQQLRALPGSLRILPGHGAESTLSAALDNAAYYL